MFGRGGTSIRVEGLPGVEKMLAPYADARQMANTLRRAVRAGAQPMKASLAEVARSMPTGRLPANFAKVKAPRVSTRGGASGREITASVRPDAALFPVFESGATSHEIGDGGLLAGPAGPRWRPKAFAARGRVRHPGMHARPILPTAFERGRGAAMQAAANVLFGQAK